MSENPPHRPLILGAMVRTIGAYPSGWRHPEGHDTPSGDAAVLARIAELGEAAGLDYLFFGDWLATGPDLEFRDPYLLARIDPLSAITFLAGLTQRIGLIATVNTTYADAYTFARSAASVDVLSSGRAGVNLVTGAEPRAAGNHGRDAHADNESRYDRAEEFVTAVRALWSSWDADAWVADKAGGRLIDAAKLHRADFGGHYVRTTGPLNAARPPQGHLPIVHAGTSPRSREFAANHADLALIAAPELGLAKDARAHLRAAAAAAGRHPDDLRVIAPVLPVVAETTAEAQAIVDALLSLVPVDEGQGAELPEAFPTNRSLAALLPLLDVEIDPTTPLDQTVPREVANRFTDAGARLVRLVTERTGRTIEGEAPVTWRQLLVTHAVPASFVVGDPVTVADHFERWHTERAADGFNVLSAFQPGQFEAFTTLVVPELRRRGLLAPIPEGAPTLRERLGLAESSSVSDRVALAPSDVLDVARRRPPCRVVTSCIAPITPRIARCPDVAGRFSAPPRSSYFCVTPRQTRRTTAMSRITRLQTAVASATVIAVFALTACSTADSTAPGVAEEATEPVTGGTLVTSSTRPTRRSTRRRPVSTRTAASSTTSPTAWCGKTPRRSNSSRGSPRTGR